MTTREIAAKLVSALADTHPDIRKHYDLQALENQFAKPFKLKMPVVFGKGWDCAALVAYFGITTWYIWGPATSGLGGVGSDQLMTIRVTMIGGQILMAVIIIIVLLGFKFLWNRVFSR